ncbi:MAG: TetR/AcrR family transcriptional regulator [Actinomycetales bacterium]|nr:TetR/AcrR family transcriptional regulator [Actinomycetales bacterium]
MPRPRFEKLPVEQQRAILAAALREFAAHGYQAASLNRIIESAGISKGSMYYYFDDKDDLYAEVIRRELTALIERGGPIPPPPDTSPEEFWGALEELYLRLMRLLEQSPEAAALMRGWMGGAGGPSPQQTQEESVAAMGPWLMRAIDAGQRAGAVRTDLPPELIVGMAVSMGTAMDAWLLTQAPERHAESVALLMVFAFLR